MTGCLHWKAVEAEAKSIAALASRCMELHCWWLRYDFCVARSMRSLSVDISLSALAGTHDVAPQWRRGKRAAEPREELAASVRAQSQREDETANRSQR